MWREAAAETLLDERGRLRRRDALPFLTILAPSQRANAERGRRHKPLTRWAIQAIL
jgi:hypothetical protein